MLLIHSLFLYSYSVDILNIPFDRGANKIGSKHAYNFLKDNINNIDNLNINNVYHTECENEKVQNILHNGYLTSYNILNNNNFPLLIGGDHTTAISNIFASNDYCIEKNHSLGVLWFDAHADFNTIETSPSGNIHGVPVAILCGHTLRELQYGNILSPSQFIYYGIRDIDSLEFNRFRDYNMAVMNNLNDLTKFINKYDKIHLSFDLDCLDPSIMSCVNTKVKNGVDMKNMREKLDYIKYSNKLISMDLVEYNPLLGNNANIIEEILNSVF